MRIAQVAPLYESVPPRLYGGTERVVSWLTEELVRQGHEVTLFATADSLTNATLVPICSQALRLDPNCWDPIAHHVHQIEQVLQRQDEFDVVHFHIDYLHFPTSRRERLPATHDPSRPPRHPGSSSFVPRVFRLAGRIHIRSAAATTSLDQLAGYGSSRNAERQVCPWFRFREVSCVSWAHLS